MAYVYLLIEKPFEGEFPLPWTKIGYTKNPPRWCVNANIRRGNPREIVTVRVFFFASEIAARSAEKEAHRKFATTLARHEWFNVDWWEIDAWCVANGFEVDLELSEEFARSDKGFCG